DQQRPELFALAIKKPELLYHAVEEAPERLGPDGETLKALDKGAVEAALRRLKAQGVESLAVVFLHAWRNPAHELSARRIAQRIGFKHISVSHQTLSIIQVVGRGRTTLVDAYLTPVLHQYAQQVRRWTGAIPLHFMSSSGSLLAPQGFTGKDAILSGPAGGVLGAAGTAAATGEAQVIGFDMGGTSTDVCRYGDHFERVLEVETAGIRYQAPMLHVETVAAGGGSKLDFVGGKLTVGPESCGASPGPACYGLGGPAAVTDANLVLGRVIPALFPRAFGADHQSPLDPTRSHDRLEEIARRVGEKSGHPMGVETLALGYLRIANEAMGRPIKALSVARGLDLREHALVSFGGAGGQHACGIARNLGMRRVHLHPLAGLLSAYGIATAAHRRHRVETLLVPASPETLKRAEKRAAEIAAELEMDIRADLKGSAQLGAGFQRRLEVDLRVPGTESPIGIPFSSDAELLSQHFQEAHRRLYGFDAPEGFPELVHLKVDVSELESNARQVWERGLEMSASRLGEALQPVAGEQTSTLDLRQSAERTPVWFSESGPEPTPVVARDQLPVGRSVAGPLLVMEAHSVVVVEPGFSAQLAASGILTLTLEEAGESRTDELVVESAPDPVLLELFNHRFMGIAARMGETLARTAHSVNMKERLDFSCAIFDRQGRLIANAPHIPVHLGAMGETVQRLIEARQEAGGFQQGEVFASNDPHAGGSHLPDVTVITPLFRRGEAAFFVAARGHHADIGGIAPGSMPPFARHLWEEGVVLTHLPVVRHGVFRERAVLKALSSGPYPARNLPERLSDLRAQIAANQSGIEALGQLCDHYGDAMVSAYMGHMRDNAAEAMREALTTLLDGQSRWKGRFQDSLDGGEKISVSVDIYNDSNGKPQAKVDFTGTSAPHSGNLNAPPAVTRAAVLYVFRTLIRREIPLNDGCLDPIHMVIPAQSLLRPGHGAAVAGGNVETSQRVVDVLYGALGVAAASQGTMNNLLFGALDGGGKQYYETIAGGSGAVEGATGASGVQVHMTNTRMTDPEVLEHRFREVRLEKFHLRRGSGGKGRWSGGDGVVRLFRFLQDMAVTLVTERRCKAPFGLHGGGTGAEGENHLWRSIGERDRLPGRFQGILKAGERLEIRTPGGGGFQKSTER
ncbi:MAG: hydantoinase B/oxoprolinase family protein, partial [Magnetococcales bacterium]|nr:hydantoinase B/oxoprolinase family protein [Magnetococcales bacterium]